MLTRPFRRCLTRVAHSIATVCFPAAAAWAQGSTPDTVRGVVFDSLLKAPLVGATVVATLGGSGESVSAVSDTVGLFTLVAPVRIERVAVYHDDLDRLGLSALDAIRPAGAGPWRVQVATPSLATMWLTLCERPMPPGNRTTIVFGTLRLGDNRTRVSGAAVVIGWEPDQLLLPERENDTRQDSLITNLTARTRSRSTGEFLFCGLPSFGQAGVQASGSALRSSAVLLLADGRPVRRVDLILGDSAVRASVQGRVTDGDGRAVADATVSVDGVETTVLTNANGEFILPQVPTGSRMLTARKVGFVPAVDVTDVLDNGTRDVRLTVQRGITLDGVRITARRTLNRDAVDFNQRRLAGLGSYLDAKDVMKYPRLQDALRMFPSLTVLTANNGVDFQLLGRQKTATIAATSMSMSGCAAAIYTDGIVDSPNFVSLLPLESIASIEVFNNGAFAPARYRNFTDNCAVVLIWTKAYLSR